MDINQPQRDERKSLLVFDATPGLMILPQHMALSMHIPKSPPLLSQQKVELALKNHLTTLRHVSHGAIRGHY